MAEEVAKRTSLVLGGFKSYMYSLKAPKLRHLDGQLKWHLKCQSKGSKKVTCKWQLKIAFNMVMKGLSSGHKSIHAALFFLGESCFEMLAGTVTAFSFEN